MRNNTLKLFISSVIIATCLTACGSSTSSSKSADYNNSADSNAGFAADVAVMGDTGLAGASYSDEAFRGDSSVEESDGYTTNESDEDYVPVDDTAPEEKVNIKEKSSDMLVSSKLVYIADLEIETLDYASTISAIKNLITKYDAIIQSENERNNADNWYQTDYYKRSGTMTNSISIRVPSKYYYDFVNSLDGYGQIRNKVTTTDNISQKYYDTTIRIKSLQLEEDRLLKMMEEAMDINDMIEVEKRLNDVQSELLQLQTNIKYMDMDVAYSYVNINIREVVEYTEEDAPIKTSRFIDRLQNTLKETWDSTKKSAEAFLFGLIRALPTLIVITIIIVIFKKLIWKKIKKSFEDKQNTIQSRVNTNNAGNVSKSELMALLKYKEARDREVDAILKSDTTTNNKVETTDSNEESNNDKEEK